MEFSEFNEEDMAESILQRGKHANTDVIQPWANKRSNTRTMPFRRDREERSRIQRKKTMDERIEEMYRKYSKEGMSTNRQGRANSRQFYREMLKEFSKAQEFRQLGSKRQESELIGEQLSMDLVRRKVSSNSCSYDYKQIYMQDSPQKLKHHEPKYLDRFQRMLKIRDKVRKKNSQAVSKLKEKYLSQYNPLSVIIPRSGQIDGMHSDKERAKLRMKLRNKAKSNNLIDPPPRLDLKIVGANSKQADFLTSRSNISTHRNSKPSLNLRHTLHVFNN